MPPPLCLRPSRPPRPSLPPCQRPPPHSRLILDCSRPPSAPTPSLALTSSPLLLSIRAPLRPLHPPSLSLYLTLSLSISPHRTFSSSPFFLGTRRRLPFVLVSHPLFHGHSVRSALAPRVALRSPLENVLTTSVLLFLRRSARLLSRERARARAVCFAIIHCVFCTFCVLRESYSLSSLAFTAASQFFHRRFPFPAYLPIQPERGALAPFLSRNSESRFRSRMFFSPLFFVSSSSSFSFPLFFSP